MAPLATADEVAVYLGIPTRTLAQWRYLGKGPRWSKVGRHCRYRWTDVETWLDSQAGVTVTTAPALARNP